MQGIVIQGPTDYCEQIVECYKGISNVVWSTWDTESQYNLQKIQGSNIDVILNKKPSFNGAGNINYQTVSTAAGISYLISKGVTEVLKIRGDVIITNVPKLMSLLEGRKLSFLQMCKEGVRTDLYYELVYQHFSHDYPTDNILYGDAQVMLDGFNFLVEQPYPCPAESLITYHLFKSLNIEFNLTYSHFIKNGITFFMQECLDHNIDLYFIKYNRSIINETKDKTYYDY